MHILLVAPPMLALNLGRYLEHRGHVVDYAATGTFALLQAGARGFDAVVVAARLPDMDGQRVCRTLRKTLRVRAPSLLLLDLKAGMEPSLLTDGAEVQMVGDHAFESIHGQIVALCRQARLAKVSPFADRRVADRPTAD